MHNQHTSVMASFKTMANFFRGSLNNLQTKMDESKSDLEDKIDALEATLEEKIVTLEASNRDEDRRSSGDARSHGDFAREEV